MRQSDEAFREGRTVEGPKWRLFKRGKNRYAAKLNLMQAYSGKNDNDDDDDDDDDDKDDGVDNEETITKMTTKTMTKTMTKTTTMTIFKVCGWSVNS